MSPQTPATKTVWLDGTAAKTRRRDLTETEWPRTPTGNYADISRMASGGEVVVCKSIPGIAYAGADTHTRLYRVKHRRCWPFLPRLDLHGGPNPWSSIWATYRAISFQEAWIELPRRSSGSSMHGRVKVHRKQSGRKNKYVFTMKVRGHEETFGWRRSHHARIKGLGLSGRGYKLVRLMQSAKSAYGPRTSDRRQIVAIAARSRRRMSRCMAFRFLNSFGDEWEVVSLVTLLALWFWH